VRKSYYKILLPILFITGLNTDYTNGQGIKEVPVINTYTFDSMEVAEIAKIILENDMLKENEILSREKDSLYRQNNELFGEKIKRMQEIIDLKEQQIRRFEPTPQILKKKGWKWWQYTLAAVGAVCAGFTAGVIYGLNQ
jgi:hypothetical protein